MRNVSIQTALAVFFFIVIAGLLIWRRFDLQTQLPVVLQDSSGSEQTMGHVFKRGEIIETKTGEYLFVKIGNDISVGIDERSKIELSKIYANEYNLRFTRGRIVITNTSDVPIIIETNKTENIIAKGKALFINYDYQQMVTIAPIVNSVQTRVKGSNEYMVLPVSINIHEQNPVWFSKTEKNPEAGASAEFHKWLDSISPPPSILSPS